MDYYGYPLSADFLQKSFRGENVFIQMLATQGLQFLKKLHGIGFVHGDIKTGNILINPPKITFIDFGLSTPFVDQFGAHIKESDVKQIVSSSWNHRLLSPWHLGAPDINRYLQTPRDDLFRFAEVILEMSSLSLDYSYPDDMLDEHSSVEDWIILKTSSRLGRMSGLIKDFYIYTLGLRFGETATIQYDYWINEFSKL